MGSVDQWVNDELYNILGISDRTIGQFIIALARKSTDAEDLLRRFRETDALDINPRVQKFAGEIMTRLPHAGMEVKKRFQFNLKL